MYPKPMILLTYDMLSTNVYTSLLPGISSKYGVWGHRDDLIAALHSRKFHFSILMHQDGSAPAIEYIAGARILQVCTQLCLQGLPPTSLQCFQAIGTLLCLALLFAGLSCAWTPPHSRAAASLSSGLSSTSNCLQVYASCAWDQLRDHLLSSHASHADAAAAALDEGRSTQAAALQQARHALGAAQVISVCSEADRGHVIDAARRLCTHAPAISAAIDLAGAAYCESCESCHVTGLHDGSSQLFLCVLPAPGGTCENTLEQQHEGVMRALGTIAAVFPRIAGFSMTSRTCAARA